MERIYIFNLTLYHLPVSVLNYQSIFLLYSVTCLKRVKLRRIYNKVIIIKRRAIVVETTRVAFKNRRENVRNVETFKRARRNRSRNWQVKRNARCETVRDRKTVVEGK